MSKQHIISSKNVAMRNGQVCQVQFYEDGEAVIRSQTSGLLVAFGSDLKIKMLTGPGRSHFRNEAEMYAMLKKAAQITVTIPQLRTRVYEASSHYTESDVMA